MPLSRLIKVVILSEARSAESKDLHLASISKNLGAPFFAQQRVGKHEPHPAVILTTNGRKNLNNADEANSNQFPPEILSSPFGDKYFVTITESNTYSAAKLA
jgi:hypothetical protein